ncbi:MAG: hypothetical protein L3J39_17965, partial [Verrucomicrobiales bacterium]|nr:hypothetical protein [Verrucomicrobiales bacterium]
CTNGTVFIGSQAGGSTITGTECDDVLLGYNSGNTLNALGGDDLLQVTASYSYGSGFYSEGGGVFGEGGGASGKVYGNANADDNVLLGGDGNDTLSVSARSEASLKSSYGEIGGVDARVNVAANADNNLLSGGGGSDPLSVSAEGKAFASAYGEGFTYSEFGPPTATPASVNADTNTDATGNVLIGGEGELSVSAQGGAFGFAASEHGRARANVNTNVGARENLLVGSGDLSVEASGGAFAFAVQDSRPGTGPIFPVIADAESDVDARSNVLIGGDAADELSVGAKAYASGLGFGDGGTFVTVIGETTADADDNVLDGGAGDDTLQIGSFAGSKAYAASRDEGSFGGDDTYAEAESDGDAQDNSLYGGSGDDLMSVSAISVSAARSYTEDNYAEALTNSDANATDNLLEGDSGDDTLSVYSSGFSYSDAESKYDEAYAEAYADGDARRNTLMGGSGSDELTVAARAGAFAEADSVNEANVEAKANSDADNNVLSGGDGEDLLTVTARTDARAVANSSDNDAYAEAYAGSRATNNDLQGGAGNDTLSVGAYSEASASGEGDDGVDFDAYADSRANNNTLLGGDGDDVLTVTARAEASSSELTQGGANADNNSLVGGAGDDTLTVYSYTSADGGRGSSVANNTLIGGAGADVITETAVGSSVIGSTIFGGDGNDRLSLSASGYDGPGGGYGEGPPRGGYGEGGYGEGPPRRGYGEGGGLFGNAVYGDAGDDFITVQSDQTGQSIQGVLDANTIDGGVGEDTLKINGEGAVSLAGGVSNIEVLDLQNESYNYISLSASDVAAMTDDDNILRIAGDGIDVIDFTDWNLDSGPGGDGFFTFVSSLGGGEQIETNITTELTPIVLDLNGDGLSFTQIGGNQFDVDGDGQLENISWAGAGDAVLAYDANGDGMISSLEEIAFTSYVPGATSDLEGLGAFDSNGDGIFSAEDDAFGSFFLWQEVNLDGVGSGLELVSLADAGIASINLDALNTDGYGVEHVFVQGTGEFTWEDGSTGQLADAIFLSQEQPVDLDGVLDDGSGADPDDEALVAAVDENTGGGGDSGSGAGDVPEIPELPASDGSDPLDPTEDELAAV